MRTRLYVAVVLACMCLIALVTPSCNKHKGTKLREDTSIGSKEVDISRFVVASFFVGDTQDYTAESISVWLKPCSKPPGTPTDVTLYLQTGPDATSTPLSQKTLSTSIYNGWYDFVLDTQITIPVGQAFYIRLSVPSTGMCWILNEDSTRAFLDGSAFLDGVNQSTSGGAHQEFSFKVYSVETF